MTDSTPSPTPTRAAIRDILGILYILADPTHWRYDYAWRFAAPHDFRSPAAEARTALELLRGGRLAGRHPEAEEMLSILATESRWKHTSGRTFTFWDRSSEGIGYDLASFAIAALGGQSSTRPVCYPVGDELVPGPNECSAYVGIRHPGAPLTLLRFMPRTTHAIRLSAVHQGELLQLLERPVDDAWEHRFAPASAEDLSAQDLDGAHEITSAECPAGTCRIRSGDSEIVVTPLERRRLAHLLRTNLRHPYDHHAVWPGFPGSTAVVPCTLQLTSGQAV